MEHPPHSPTKMLISIVLSSVGLMALSGCGEGGATATSLAAATPTLISAPDAPPVSVPSPDLTSAPGEQTSTITSAQTVSDASIQSAAVTSEAGADLSAAPANDSGLVAKGPVGWLPMTPITLDLRQQNSGASWSYTVLPSDGSRRYEVRQGDVWSGDKSVGNERSESYSSFHASANKTYQINFKMLLEPGGGNIASWLVLTQMNAVLDPGEAVHSPPFAMELRQNRLSIVTRSSSAALSTPNDTFYNRNYEDNQDLVRGRWYDIKIQITFDPFGRGKLRVWRDDLLLVDYSGALGFNDVVGPYLKQGIYRSPTNQTLAIRFKGLVMGYTG